MSASVLQLGAWNWKGLKDTYDHIDQLRGL